MTADILHPITGDSSLQSERQYLAALWADPVTGHDLAIIHRLSGGDFWGQGHSLVFTYCCLCAEMERPLSESEVLALSPSVDGELSRATLDAILETQAGTDDLDYALAVRQAADDRRATELRELCRIGLREWGQFQRWLAHGGSATHQTWREPRRGNGNARSRDYPHRTYHDPSVRRGA